MQHWRRKIAEGDNLDVCIKISENIEDEEWVQASVTTIVGDKLTLLFDQIEPQYDGVFNRWSRHLAPFESRTKEDYAWRRENLIDCIETEVDALKSKHWYKSTILNTEK